MTNIRTGNSILTAETFDRLDTGTLTQSTGVHQLENTNRQIFGVIIQNDPDGQNPVWVGNAMGQYFQLNGGATLTLGIDSLAKVYIRFTAAATVNWIAMG